MSYPSWSADEILREMIDDGRRQQPYGTSSQSNLAEDFGLQSSITSAPTNSFGQVDSKTQAPSSTILSGNTSSTTTESLLHEILNAPEVHANDSQTVGGFLDLSASGAPLAPLAQQDIMNFNFGSFSNDASALLPFQGIDMNVLYTLDSTEFKSTSYSSTLSEGTFGSHSNNASFLNHIHVPDRSLESMALSMSSLNYPVPHSLLPVFNSSTSCSKPGPDIANNVELENILRDLGVASHSLQPQLERNGSSLGAQYPLDTFPTFQDSIQCSFAPSLPQLPESANIQPLTGGESGWNSLNQVVSAATLKDSSGITSDIASHPSGVTSHPTSNTPSNINSTLLTKYLEFEAHDVNAEDGSDFDDCAPVVTNRKSRKLPVKSSSKVSKTSGTRVNRELLCFCMTCSTRMATLFLFGDAAAFSLPYAVEAQCSTCFPFDGSDQVPSGLEAEISIKKVKKKKKEGMNRTMEMACQICSSTTGFGGVRLNTSEVGVGEGDKTVENDELPHDGQWIKPDFGVEVICVKCFTDFKFCSKCGGGGLWRSGRWRPKELFAEGRKTCRLPHIRPGNPAQFKYAIYRIPVTGVPEMDPYGGYLLKGDSTRLEVYTSEPMQNVPYADLPITEAQDRLATDVSQFWSTASLNSIADALTMQRANFAETWTMVSDTDREFTRQLDLIARGQFNPDADLERLRGKRVRRFLGIAFFPNPKNTKKRARKKAEDVTGDTTQKNGTSAAQDEPEYLIGGSATCQWFIEDQHLCWRFGISLGQTGLHPNSMIPILMVNIFARLKQDFASEKISPPLPLHFWGFPVWGQGRERTRKSILPEVLRFGGKSIEDYAEIIGSTEEELRELLVEGVMPPDMLAERDIFIVGWQEAQGLMRTMDAKRLVA
ncbi:hypothetical protein BC829DRAFT_447769 [Chytridium lagenaria]|nr:hypothetical protein BC829DRAFT_447769 [Chytridium lagenaria]